MKNKKIEPQIIEVGERQYDSIIFYADEEADVNNFIDFNFKHFVTEFKKYPKTIENLEIQEDIFKTAKIDLPDKKEYVDAKFSCIKGLRKSKGKKAKLLFLEKEYGHEIILNYYMKETRLASIRAYVDTNDHKVKLEWLGVSKVNPRFKNDDRCM